MLPCPGTRLPRGRLAAMDDAVLLHLTTPAEWRTALDTGALIPPSLAVAGFVHLATPEQVHLPAERLFPGRRDVVALVVDPARLSAPVRFKPGEPGDPASMRFPPLRAAADLGGGAVATGGRGGAALPRRRPSPGPGTGGLAAHPAGRRGARPVRRVRRPGPGLPVLAHGQPAAAHRGRRRRRGRVDRRGGGGRRRLRPGGHAAGPMPVRSPRSSNGGAGWSARPW
jgi:uncharacterized protein (DUF952 family)